MSRIAHVFPQAISAFAIPDHRLALTSYLEQCGMAFVNDGKTVIVKEAAGTALTAAFDEQNRLTKMDVTLKGGPK